MNEENTIATAMLFQYGKTTFAHGLFWQSLSKPRELKKEALELAVRNKDDLYLIRSSDGIAQTALANSVAGYAPGQVSFAATLAAGVQAKGLKIYGEHIPTASWMGLFNLGNDKWAFVAVRDNAIMPSGDFLGTFQEAYERLDQNYGLGSWSAVIGTPEIEGQYHNFITATYEDFIPASKNGKIKVDSKLTLRGTKFKVKKAYIIAAVVLGISVLGSTFAYMQWKEAKEQRERE